MSPSNEPVAADTEVGIVGLCGGGSHVAQQLAHIGVGRFRLFDPDTADETNTGRMVGLSAKDSATERGCVTSCKASAATSRTVAFLRTMSG